jgi:hypothetical protein
MIVAWNPEHHLPLIGSWLSARGKAADAGDARLYPSTGLVVDRCAAGFVFTTNAPLVGYLDGLVTDPAAPVRRRYFATRLLLSRICEMAKGLGVELLMVATDVRGLVGICEKEGFSMYGSGFSYLCKRV